MSNWYYSKNGQQLGPVAQQQLEQMVAQGVVTAADLVWQEGMAEWSPAGQVFPGARAGQPAGAPPPGAYGGGAAPMYPGYQGAPYAVDESGTQKTLAIVGIVLGCIGFLFCPIVFGVGGIVCASIAKKKRGQHAGLANTALIISIIGTVGGMIIGALFFGLTRH